MTHADADAGVDASAGTVVAARLAVQRGSARGGMAPRSPVRDSDAASSPELRVETVLAWLEANRYLSAERFAESRVNARSARFGNVRIRHELSQHEVTLSAELARTLQETEFARAATVRERKFGAVPDSAKESARQARFLAARGFSTDVIRRALRAARTGESE